MDGRFASRGTARHARGARRAAAGLALTALALLVGCSDSGADTTNGSGPARAGQAAGGLGAGEDTAAGGVSGQAAEETGDEATPPAETDTTDADTTAAPAEEEAIEPSPGEPCSLEEGLADCIDPDGDGEGTYLIGGADCIAAWPDSPSYCEDLDGDGYAGYPDGEGWGDDEGDEDEATEPSPGEPCSLEEGLADCIDPDGDGEGTYLIGGADCIAAWPDSPSYCEDLDGDGYAGYPDGEGWGGDEGHGWDEGDGDDHDDGTGIGSPCSKEEGSPDCVDPDGDGEGTILEGGEECIAMYADESFCGDTDGDGYAGERGGDGELPYPLWD